MNIHSASDIQKLGLMKCAEAYAPSRWRRTASYNGDMSAEGPEPTQAHTTTVN